MIDPVPSMKGMQYTFPVAPPAPTRTKSTTAPAIHPIIESTHEPEDHDMASADDKHAEPHEIQLPASPALIAQPASELSTPSIPRSGYSSVIRFPALFNSDFSPTALLGPAAPDSVFSAGDVSARFTFTSSDENSMSVARPTFEFPLDELMNSPDALGSAGAASDDGHDVKVEPNVASSAAAEFHSFQHAPPPSADKPDLSRLSIPLTFSEASFASPSFQSPPQPTTLSPSSDLISPFSSSTTFTTVAPTPTPPTTTRGRPRSSSKHQRDDDNFTPPSMPARTSRHAHSASVPLISQLTPVSYESAPVTTVSAAPSRRNSLKAARHAAPSATPPPRAQRPNHGNTAPGGVKSECANCGATSTPLWRRGLNDELNCNVNHLPFIHPYCVSAHNLFASGLRSICEAGQPYLSVKGQFNLVCSFPPLDSSTNVLVQSR